MSASRWIAGAAIVAAGSVAALAGPADAKLPGNAGSFVAFDRGGDIRVLSDEGAGSFDVNITNSPGVQDSSPSWGLPDHNCLREDNGVINVAGGRTLVYESRAGGDSDIVLAKLTGNPPSLASAPLNLTTASPEDDGAPAVGTPEDAAIAPERSRAIVFTRGPVGHRHIWVMGMDGSKQTQLTHGSADESNPDWSWEGKSVVYETADAAGKRQLAIVDVVYDSRVGFVVSADPPRFITTGPEDHGNPSWYGLSLSDDADPSRIVHVATAFGATYLDFIEQAPPTTGSLFSPGSVPAPLLRQLTGDPGGDLAPSWRPHGDSVVFESDRAQPGNRDIYRIDADGTRLVRLTQNAAADHAPDWEVIGGGCLTPEPYSPRPGTQTRTPKPAPKKSPGTSPSGSKAPVITKPRTNPSLKVTGLRVSTAGRGKRRIVIVRFFVNRPAQATARLRRGKRTVARKINQSLRAGAATIRLNLPSKARGGRHSVQLTVSAGSTKLPFTRSVRIRSLRSRR